MVDELFQQPYWYYSWINFSFWSWHFLLSTDKYEDQTYKASGRWMVLWKAAQRTGGRIPRQLRGDKVASARGAAAVTRATGHSPRSLRLRTSPKGRSVLHSRWHHFSHISTQRRVVFWWMQRSQRTIPCQLCSIKLILYYFYWFEASIHYRGAAFVVFVYALFYLVTRSDTRRITLLFLCTKCINNIKKDFLSCMRIVESWYIA